MPSELWAERQRLPPGFLEQIVEYRAYAATKAMFDTQQNPKAESLLLLLVKEIEQELGAEAYEARKQGQ